ncbi:MAG: oxidoreductase [Thermoleophilia bacterium]
MSEATILGTPLKIGTRIAKNRIGLSPMCVNLGDSLGHVTQRTIDYYEARARGGAGVVIVENAHVDGKASRGMSAMLAAHSDGMLPGLNGLAEAITRHGALAILQINHMGRQGDPSLIDGPLVAPSAEADPVVGSVPRALEADDLESIKKAFCDTAARAVAAGFDGVEVHMAHGYLLSEFLTPSANHRSDEYGGSLENRMRYPLEVLGAVRTRLGTDAIVGVRLNGDDYLGEAGLTVEQAAVVAARVEQSGADYVNVSAAVYASVPWMVPPLYAPPATNIHLAERIRASVGVPVLAAGSVLDKGLAEDILTTGKADVVLLGRGLIADPDLPAKWLHDNTDQVRRCIRCNDGCIQRLLDKVRVTCAINPLAGHEREWALRPVAQANARRVLIAGGGPAGLEAARVAALRGHRVTLCESEPELGGQVRFGCLPSFKADLRGLIPYYRRQLADLDVDIRTGTEVTVALVGELTPDLVIVAVGAEPSIPVVPGVERAVLGRDIHANPGIAGRSVVVVGGGLVGCEVALELAETDRRVTVVEALPEVLPGMNLINRLTLLARLAEHGVRLATGSTLTAVTDRSVLISGADARAEELEAETVVIATGLLPRRRLAGDLAAQGVSHLAVGDCITPRNIMRAIHAGFHAAREL